MPASSGSAMSSSLPSLSPSPRESGSTSSSGAGFVLAPPPPPPPAPPVKERKKPGPKPKPKIPPSKIIKLKLKPEILAAFPHAPAGNDKSVQDSSPTTQVSPGREGSSPVNSDVNLAQAPERPRGVPGPKPGSKRGRQPGALLGKPGRKKTKLDPNASPASSMNGISHHANHGKLGPKANQGAINAQLRALDRTGKPCKRWSKATFSLKSFTGVQWTVPTWGAPISDQSAPPTPPAGSQMEEVSAAPSVTSETPEIRVHADVDAMNVDTEFPAQPFVPNQQALMV